jgi:hypothetical protein
VPYHLRCSGLPHHGNVGHSCNMKRFDWGIIIAVSQNKTQRSNADLYMHCLDMDIDIDMDCRIRMYMHWFWRRSQKCENSVLY